MVAGNPKSRSTLDLPGPREVERCADPKRVLREAISQAANVTGRRRERLGRRFTLHRRQLLQELDIHGPVSQLDAWQHLVHSVDDAVAALRGSSTS
ncbi:MAG: hypothetical protein ACRC35_02990, partial [Angustibacter sp.]